MSDLSGYLIGILVVIILSLAISFGITYSQLKTSYDVCATTLVTCTTTSNTCAAELTYQNIEIGILGYTGKMKNYISTLPADISANNATILSLVTEANPLYSGGTLTADNITKYNGIVKNLISANNPPDSMQTDLTNLQTSIAALTTVQKQDPIIINFTNTFANYMSVYTSYTTFYHKLTIVMDCMNNYVSSGVKNDKCKPPLDIWIMSDADFLVYQATL
jgi:hypothetical protein